jgi:hypothetical protein
MKFLKINGVDVTVRVSDADEARHALKELRLARKQTLHEKRGLARELKAAEEREEKPSRGARSRGKASGEVTAAGYVWKSLAAVARFAAGKPEPVADADDAPPPPASAASLERQITAATALTHNIDAVILEIEARLLKEKAKKA